mmetsp:Transcript_56017/g.123049  ORF Transcript_56017/g.123049 Transcript_56017/m.123049 type:complete len:115 (+) Transcript_56017:467-811(+)
MDALHAACAWYQLDGQKPHNPAHPLPSAGLALAVAQLLAREAQRQVLSSSQRKTEACSCRSTSAAGSGRALASSRKPAAGSGGGARFAEAQCGAASGGGGPEPPRSSLGPAPRG